MFDRSDQGRIIWGVSLRLAGLFVPLIIIVATILNSRIESLERRVSRVEERQTEALLTIQSELKSISQDQRRISKWISQRPPRSRK